MRTETAQRVLWYAMLFVVLMIIVTIMGAVAFAVAFSFIDLGSFIADPTARAFLEAYPLFIPGVLAAFALVELIYLAVIYLWRKDPMAHRTGFTLLGIIQLLVGFSLLGLLILLPGLLLEPDQ
ncbi:MAG: hypothetical protein ACFFEF_01120 [Candidatus Thorarchaeota archaeon]